MTVEEKGEFQEEIKPTDLKKQASTTSNLTNVTSVTKSNINLSLETQGTMDYILEEVGRQEAQVGDPDSGGNK